MSRYERPRFRITTWQPVLPAPVQVGVPAFLGHYSTYEQVIEAVEQRIRSVSSRGPGARVRVMAKTAQAAEAAVMDRVARPSGAYVAFFGDITIKEVAPDLFLRGLYASGRDVSSMLTQLGPLRVPAGLLEEACARAERADDWDEEHPEWHWRSLCAAMADIAGGPRGLRGEELPLLVKARSAPDGIPLLLHAFSVSQQISMVQLYRGVLATVIRLAELCSAEGASAFAKVHQTWTASGWPVPNTGDQAVLTASRVLNLTTVGCGPRLDLATSQGAPFPRATAADLLSTLATQMVAHVSAGAPARRCAHPPCGRWFTHHQGRAEHDRHRSRGVRYCSSSCARAAAQRAYRDRRRSPAAREN